MVLQQCAFCGWFVRFVSLTQCHCDNCGRDDIIDLTYEED